MSCDNCKKIEAKLDALNAAIEEMFIYAFGTGYQTGSTKAIKAISDNSVGALNSGLFPDLARMSMKEYFSLDNPPQPREKKTE